MAELASPLDPEREELELRVNGQTLRRWKKVSVIRSLEKAAGSFTVSTVTGRFLPLRVRPGDRVEARLAGGHRLITGYVDGLDADSNVTKIEVSVSGRDAAGQLVDCTAELQSGELLDHSLEDLVRAIAAPFGVGVVTAAGFDGGAPFAKFTTQQGEKAWAAIERACRQRGQLAVSDGVGNLVLQVPGIARADASLVEGRNVTSSSIRYTHSDRFSIYTVKGQDAGSDDAWGEDVAAIIGTAEDPEVATYRPLLVVAEGVVSFQSAADRAQWEATVRAARSAQVKVTVPGWRQKVEPDSRPWALNELVPVQIPSLGVQSLMLVMAVEFSLDAQGGNVTQITLTRGDAYLPQPQVDESANPFADFLVDESFGEEGFDVDDDF